MSARAYRVYLAIVCGLLAIFAEPSQAPAMDALIAIGGHEIELAGGGHLEPSAGSFEVFELISKFRRADDGGISYKVRDETGRQFTITDGDVFVRHDVDSLDTVRQMAQRVSTSPWPALEKRQVLEGFVDLGMSKAEVTSAWGSPERVERDGSREIYRYSSTALVFQQGTLTEIH